jgi:cation diffusion facilitator CzcD-associated flavoprotein CzcO
MIVSRNGMSYAPHVPFSQWTDYLNRKLVVENVKTGETIHDDADVLISARGNLNDKAWPKIPGFETFKGEVMHSAQWNEELVSPLLGRRQLIVADMTSRINELG